jgi:16S rRNA (cytosine967-C5)-methyltransferase
VSKEVIPFQTNAIDLILLDVPCSGSGTWGRTPEYLRIFDESEVDRYAALQRKIITNSIPYLKNDGVLLYSTCSVFQKENEENVRFIQQEHGLKLLYQEVIKGYTEKADSMFIAALTY